MSDTNSRGFNPVGEKFLNRRDLFGLKFSDGYVFAEVESKEFSQYGPYDSIEVNGTEGDPLGPGEASEFQTLTHNGDEILHISGREKQEVIHASIGQYPQSIRRYTNYPEASNRMHQIENLSAPRRGSEYGYVDGYDSPFNNPSDAEELIIPPEVSLDFAFSNPSSRQKDLMANIVLTTYGINVIDPRQNKDTVKRILSPGSPMPIYPVGTGFDQIEYELNWGVDPVNRSNMGGF